MPQQNDYEQFFEKPGAVGQADPYADVWTTAARGTDPMTGKPIAGGQPIPTVAQAPGMPQTSTQKELGAMYGNRYDPTSMLAARAAGPMFGPGYPANDWRTAAAGGLAALAGGITAGPAALRLAGAAARSPMGQAVGQLAARHPMVTGLVKGAAGDLAYKAAQHIPIIGQHLPQMPAWAEWVLPLAWGGGEEIRLARAGEKAVVEKAAGKAIEGPEREEAIRAFNKLFSGQMKSKELRATSKALRAGKKAGEATAKATAEALKKSTPLGSLQEGGTVPETGQYILHKGEQVVPAPGQQSAFQRMAQQALTSPAQPAPQAPERFSPQDYLPGIGGTIQRYGNPAFKAASDYLARDPEEQVYLPIGFAHQLANRLYQNWTAPGKLLGQLPSGISESIDKARQQPPKTPLEYLKGAAQTEARVLPKAAATGWSGLKGGYNELMDPREWGNLFADLATMHFTSDIGEEFFGKGGVKAAEGEAAAESLPSNLKRIYDVVNGYNDELGEYVGGMLNYINSVQKGAKFRVREALKALEPEKSKSARKVVADVIGAEGPARAEHIVSPAAARAMGRAGSAAEQAGIAEGYAGLRKIGTTPVAGTPSPRLVKILKLLATKGSKIQTDLAREWARTQKAATPAAATGVMPVERGPII